MSLNDSRLVLRIDKRRWLHQRPFIKMFIWGNLLMTIGRFSDKELWGPLNFFVSNVRGALKPIPGQPSFVSKSF